MFDGCVFQQTVAVSMGTNYAPVLTDLFLYQKEADLDHTWYSQEKRKEASLIHKFQGFFYCIYPIEREIKDTKHTGRSASYTLKLAVKAR